MQKRWVLTVILLVGISALISVIFLFGKDRFVNEVETLFIKGHNPNDNFCYYLDLEGQQMPTNWKLSDFGYDINNLKNIEANHLGVVTNSGLKGNSCEEWKSTIGTRYTSLIAVCIGQDYASGKGIIYSQLDVQCEKGCDKNTGFCKN